jgi:hypothetical protein
MTQALYADSDLELINRLRQLFIRARDTRRGRTTNWARNLRLVHNQMNTTGIQSWQPSPRSSEIYPVMSGYVAWVMDNNISVDCIPSADPHSDYYNFQSELCNDLSAVLYTNFLVEGYKEEIKQALWDAGTFGIGVLKNVWDGERAGGMGNAMMYRIDPWQFYPDPTATSKDDMQFCIEAKYMSLDEIERRYPDSRIVLEAKGMGADVAIDERPQVLTDQSRTPMANAGAIPGSGTIGSLGASVVGRYGRPTRPKGMEADKGIVVYEFWLRENEVWYDDFSDIPQKDRPEEQKHVTSRWRIIVMAKGEILMDEFADDLWSHGEHPYEFIKFDDVGEFYGISLVDHLAYPQIYINRLLAMLQQNAELIGNPIFMEPANAGTARVPIINKPGQRLTINGIQAMQNKPDWLHPPEMPQTILELVQFWIQRIENTSGLSALTKGHTPNQRNAEGVISSVQEAAFVRIRSSISNLERSLESCMHKLADIIIDNFDQKRIMAIIGPDGEKTAGVFFRNHFMIPDADDDRDLSPMKYICQVRAGSSTPTSRGARIQEADKLFAMGIIDDQAVLEAHQYPHIKELLTRKYDKMQKGLMGGGPGMRQRSQGKPKG